MGTSTPVDVVIVGAGAAGLAAARTSGELGLSFVLLEAAGRIGGRAFTATEPFGAPWDWGCHWLHSADINPFTRLADAYGFRYLADPVPWRSHLGDRWASAAEEARVDAYVDGSYEAALLAGEAGRDEPMADHIDAADPAYWVLRHSVNAEWGVDPTLDQARYRDTDRNWPVQDGYGALVARHAAGIPVELNTPVTAIDWSGRLVKVFTPNGTVKTRAVIVTVSAGVLGAGAIRFTPVLPDWKGAAIANVPLGKANKVGLAIDADRLGVAGHTAVSVPCGTEGAIGFHLRPFGVNIASAYLAGPMCSALEREGAGAMVDAVTAALISILGSDVKEGIGATACTRWESDPLFRGAYAAARPGHADARRDLARPVDERLYFAGEATSPDFFSTCHGAHLTGIAAAQAVAAAAVGAT